MSGEEDGSKRDTIDTICKREKVGPYAIPRAGGIARAGELLRKKASFSLTVAGKTKAAFSLPYGIPVVDQGRA